jgi:endogenous inhibitor of DNA gyrase (YacG/DUF329 family)
VTKPREKVVVECPSCGRVFDDYYRSSINLSLGEEWSEQEIREETTATCPSCGHVVELGSLVVGGDGVWRWS